MAKTTSKKLKDGEALVSRKELKDALALVQCAARPEERENIPVSLVMDGQTLTLTAAGRDRMARRTIPASGELAATVALGPLVNAVGSANGEELRFALGKQLTVKGETARYSLKIIEPFGNFEQLPAKISDPVKLTAAEILAVAEKVGRFTPDNEYHPGLSGVSFAGETTATDGHRLARLDLGKKFGDPALIRPESLAFSRLLPAETEIEVQFTEVHAVFRSEGFELRARLVAESFPDTKKLVPKDFESEFTVDREALKTAVRLVRVMADDRTGAVGLLQKAGDILELSARNADGEAEDELPFDPKGEQIKLTFNGRYLLEALDTFEGPVLRFKVGGARRPVIIEDPSAPSQMHLLMPLVA